MQFITPNWAAPKNVKALTTTRLGGVSEGCFASMNLGDHVADNPEHVTHNREQLLQALSLTPPAQWLKQVHSTTVIKAKADNQCPEADACWSDEAGLACIVMTADCLPVFFCNAQGTQIAVAHAGWRGLLDGILESTLAAFSDPEQVHCWLGPAIGPNAFEVGAEVREAFVEKNSQAAAAFKPVVDKPHKYFADLYALARLRLALAGVPVTQISACDLCTYSDEERFFSYRRDGQTGRMASLIWIDAGHNS